MLGMRNIDVLNSRVERLGVVSPVEMPVTLSSGQCFTDATEVLTPVGWVSLGCYSGQCVMQVVGGGLVGEFVKPLWFEKRKFYGEMLEYDRRDCKILATADTELVFLDEDGVLNKRSLGAMPDTLLGAFLPTAISYDCRGIDLTTAQIALIIAINADGTIVKRKRVADTITFGFKKERKVERLSAILDMLDIPFHLHRSSNGVTSFYFSCPSWVVSKMFPSHWVAELSLEQRIFILSEICNWDGYEDIVKNRLEFSSKHYAECEFIKTIAETAGFQATVSKKTSGERFWYVCRVLMTKSGVFWRQTEKHIKYVWVDGDVYRISVPSSNLLIRYRGKVSVVGCCNYLVEKNVKNLEM